MKALNSIIISGKEVLPIIEGGKGVGATNGMSSGAMAAAGAVGTYSGANAEEVDDNGNAIRAIYKGKTRRERHEELIQMGISGSITQAKIAKEKSNGNGAIHINVLWEQAQAEKIIHGVFSQCSDIIDGITCGAGMPYKLGELATKYGIYYYPIVSSMRAFRALWKRSYRKNQEFLGGVVYEDPWLAGGHNGLSNSEDPTKPERPFERVALLRKFMNEVGLNNVPIIMAGGVWNLSEWEDWIDNPEVAPVAFQFGTRPLLTQESPIPKQWKNKLTSIKENDILLHQFSPTGFYSSAYKNDFINNLEARSQRQINFSRTAEGELSQALPIGARGRNVFVSSDDLTKANQYIAEGFSQAMRTPDSTLIFVTPQESAKILKSQADCMGCLSHCKFSNWKDHDDFTTGKATDPRSFCIQERLTGAIHDINFEQQLIFAGHNAFRFGKDPFYKDNFIPTVQQLVDRIIIGK